MDSQKKKEAFGAAATRATDLLNDWVKETQGMPVRFQIMQLGGRIADLLYTNAEEVGYKVWNAAIEECQNQVLTSFREAAPLPDDPLTVKLIEAWGQMFDKMRKDQEKGDSLHGSESQN